MERTHEYSGPHSDPVAGLGRRGASLDVLALQRAVGNDGVHRLLQVSNLPGDEEQVAAAIPIGEGRPLDDETRALMEARFETSFCDVRVHADMEAAGLAGALNAAAYAVGPHVVFGRDRYAPRQSAGRHLIAHELAHVIQQRGGSAPSGIVPAAGASEHAAESVARRVFAGAGPIQVSGASGPAVAMKDKENKPDWYGTAFTANRAFATHFRNKVPPGWPYSETLIKLWEATKAHWSYDESRKEIKVVDDEKAVAAARPFIDAVKEFQVRVLNRKGPAANGVLDPQTSKALAASLQTKKEPPKETQARGIGSIESQTTLMEFDIGAGAPGEILLKGAQVVDTPDWVERKLTGQQWDIFTGGFNIFCERVTGPIWIPAQYIDYGLTNAHAINQNVYPDLEAARAAIKAAAQSGEAGTPFAYYRLQGANIIFPTIFSPASSPYMITRFKAHLAEISQDVKNVMTVQAVGIAAGIGGRLIGDYAIRKSLQTPTGPSLKTPPPSPDLTPTPSEPAAGAMQPQKGGVAAPPEPAQVTPKAAPAPEAASQKLPQPIERGHQARAQQEAGAKGRTKPAEPKQSAPARPAPSKQAAPAKEAQSEQATPIERGKQYRDKHEAEARAQAEAAQKAEAAAEQDRAQVARTGTDDPVGVVQQPALRGSAPGGGPGGRKPPPPPKGGASGSSSARAARGTGAGSKGQAPPRRAQGEPIEFEDAPTGKAANDNALTRRAEVEELFTEGQGTATGRTAETPEGTGQSVKRPPGWRKQPERLTSGNWAHENFESIEKILKPNAEKLVSEKLPKGLEKEHRIPVKGLPPRSQPRVDRVDWANAEVIEIKPESLRELGEVEAKGYAEQMNIYEKRTDGKVWKGRCVTYSDERVRAFLKKVGYLE